MSRQLFHLVLTSMVSCRVFPDGFDSVTAPTMWRFRSNLRERDASLIASSDALNRNHSQRIYLMVLAVYVKTDISIVGWCCVLVKAHWKVFILRDVMGELEDEMFTHLHRIRHDLLHDSLTSWRYLEAKGFLDINAWGNRCKWNSIWSSKMGKDFCRRFFWLIVWRFWFLQFRYRGDFLNHQVVDSLSVTL